MRCDKKETAAVTVPCAVMGDGGTIQNWCMITNNYRVLIHTFSLSNKLRK